MTPLPSSAPGLVGFEIAVDDTGIGIAPDKLLLREDLARLLDGWLP